VYFKAAHYFREMCKCQRIFVQFFVFFSVAAAAIFRC